MRRVKEIFRHSLEIITHNFEILRIDNIRIYLSGQGVSLMGTWMQSTAQAWVVWQLAHTATALGIVALLSQFPSFLLGPWAGSLADRIDRRRILIITQILSMLLAFSLAFLYQSHQLVLWHVYVLALFLGIVNAFDLPTQQAFINEIAGKENVKKTVAVNNSFMQLARFVGPSLAGLVIAHLGIAPAFWLNGVSFIAVIVSLIVIHSTREIEPTREQGLKHYIEGLKYIIHNHTLRLVVCLTATQTFFGLSIVQLLPAITTTVLHRSAAALGLIVGSGGAGALVGTLLVIPFIQRYKHPITAMRGAIMFAGFWYIILSFSRSFPLSVLCQFMESMAASINLTLSYGLAHELAPEHMRARIVGTIIMVSLGLQPIASMLVGYAADVFGVTHIVLFNASMLWSIPLLLTLIEPLMIKRRKHPPGE